MPAVIVRFLLNMYTGHRTHVWWNSCESRWFDVCNGVKQGGVLTGSPVLFCVYIDGLLISLHRAGLGCHIGHMFVVALAYANGLVFVGPNPPPSHAIRSMLQCCEQYAKEYDVSFNADKSKCITSRPREVANRANCVSDVSFLMQLL